MKKALSIVLSVAMLMTIACSMFVVPASAAHINFLVPEKTEISNPGATFEYNADGDLVITCDGTAGAGIAIVGPGAYDAAVYQYTKLNLTSDVPFVVAFYDAANGKWMTSTGDFYPSFGLTTGDVPAPAGDYNLDLFTNGCYTWDGSALPATVEMSAVYLEPQAAGTMIIKDLYLIDPEAMPDYAFDAEPEFETTESFDLAVKDVDMWDQIPVSGSRVNVAANEEAGTLTLGNTSGQWPSVFIDFPDPIIMEPETAMVYADFSVMKGAKTTMYLFFGDCDANEFGSGAYAVVHNVYGGEIGAGNYKGYVSIADILPTDEAAKAACFDENGNLKLNSIKLYATSADPETAIDPAVVINNLDLLYNEAVVEDPTPDFVLGDVNSDGQVDMRDAFAVYRAASGSGVTAEIQAYADMNSDGGIDMRDAFAVYRIASGAI